MSEPTQYRIKNWTRFQHYKDRSPEWIKLHFAILASEDWTMLADASKLLAVVCMLVASRHNGMVPNKPAYLKRIAYLDAEPDLAPLISCGFLENPLADASEPEQVRTNACLEEIREEKKYTSPAASESNIEFDEWYQAYPRHVGKGQARKAYRAARRKTAPDVLLAGATAAASRYAKSDPQFIPHPATWLSGERWLDEVPISLPGRSLDHASEMMRRGFARW